jgi:succinyl-CoA synthetase beta subunit
LALKLKEYEGKELFRRFGIPTTEGYLVSKPEEVREVISPLVVKAQVQAGGRGKAGGIRFASNMEQVHRAVSEIIGMEIGGQKVTEALVEERVSIDREMYLSILLDRRSGLPKVMIIKEGGMEVENADPSLLMDWPVSPFIGVPDYIAREAALEIILDSGPTAQLAEILQKTWKLFWEMDCELVEINPLVRTHDGRMLALDAKVVLDDDAMFRHPEMRSVEEGRSQLELEARSKGLSLVQLDGDVGVIANGAGLTMATLDVLALHGAKGGVFLDLGGTDDKNVVSDALALASKTNPRVVLINIFGGITKCDTVAEGIIEAKDELDIDLNLIVRVRGVNEEKARDMLRQKGIIAMHELDEACAQAAKTGRE